MLKKTLMVLVALTMLLSFSTRAEAQLCVSPDDYNRLAWTWEYLGPCTDDYNCFAYAIGRTDAWLWPWTGYHPNEQQVTSYMRNYFNYSTIGCHARIISYVKNGVITHFSRATGQNVCESKISIQNLLRHYSWSPYKSTGAYGGISKVYYVQNNLSANISGPTQGNDGINYTWCANPAGGCPPFTYEWRYSNPPSTFTQPWGTAQCITKQLPNRWRYVYLEVTVTDSTGYQVKKGIHIENLDGVVISHRAAALNLNPAYQRLQNHIEELRFNITNSTSSNPYDYIDNDAYRKIVAMGPEALDTIKDTIKYSRKSGLNQYIMAIAAEEIAKVNLKKQSTPWATSREWVKSWRLFLRELPDKVDSIIRTSPSPEIQNERLEALGLAALPVLQDRIKDGDQALTTAFNNILNKVAVSDSDTEKRQKISKDTVIETFRHLIKKAK